MQEIIDLERRITAALERLSKTIGRTDRALPPAQGKSDAAPSDLQVALDEERMANAQLQERLRVLNERDAVQSDKSMAEISALNANQAAEMHALERQIENLTRELTALQAERRAEAEEITDIVAALNPLIEEARHA